MVADRKPLKPRYPDPTPEEVAKNEAAAAKSADEYVRNIINPPEPPAPIMNLKLPPLLVTILGLVATAGLAVSVALPPPWGAIVQAVAYLVGLVAGMSLKPPAFLAAKPLVQGTVVVGLGSLVPTLATVANDSTGWLSFAFSAASLGLAVLTGVAAPQLKGKPAEPQP
jgi:hypothetical protein